MCYGSFLESQFPIKGIDTSLVPVKECPVPRPCADDESVFAAISIVGQPGKRLHFVDPVPERRGQEVRHAAYVDQARGAAET